MRRWFALLILTGALVTAPSPAAPDGAPPAERPNILIVAIDTLRADRLSALGHERPTTPNLDRLIRGGANFARARTVEPLTNPAMCSVLTSLPPHAHGATRNGLRLRPGLPSLPKALGAAGYRTAAFVGNWTLRDKLSGLGEHFDLYEEVLTRARWFGFVRREATASDLTERTLQWVAEHVDKTPEQPFVAWVHYVEPHAPYVLQKDHVDVLGDRDGRKGDYTKEERYDTEIAYVDAAIGVLLDGVSKLSAPEKTLVLLLSDHGESLGEHGYWGHGRHLYEPGLRIPMALYWKGRLAPRTIEAPALNTDLAPTVLGLLGLRAPEPFTGYDWTAVLRDGSAAPAGRVTRFEAHKGAVISNHESDLARRNGLLEVGLVHHDVKEIFRLNRSRRYVFDLGDDPGETTPLDQAKSRPSEALDSWIRVVYDGLTSHEDMPVEPLDEESVAAMRSLGYVD
jgi:arylsulfatase A-like enzyme